MTPNPSTDGSSKWNFLGRPSEKLQLLSPEYKWEFTRRHPYYLWFWGYAGFDSSDLSEPERLRRSACQLILRSALGVNAFPPPPPSQSFEELGQDIRNTAWENGAVSPLVVRGLLACLVQTLPPECLRKCAEFMTAYAETPPENVDARYPLAQDLAEGQHPNFDDALPSLIVTLNPQAPLHEITGSIEEIVMNHRRVHAIPETRRREDKYPEYLQVWDRREGWTGEGYDNRREMRLKDICAELKIDISTAFSRYTKAFELITGHEFSPSRWMKVMGLVKFSDLPEIATPARASSRPTSDRITMVSRSDDAFAYENQDRATFRAAANREIAFLDTFAEIGSMLKAGRTSQEIVEALGISQENVPSTDQIRERFEEFRKNMRA